MRKDIAGPLVTVAFVLSTLLTACHGAISDEFPEYVLPQSIHASGSVGAGGIAVNSGALRADVWSLATDADLEPAKVEVRASLVSHDWTIDESTASKVGAEWYRATSPDGETCLRYLTMDAESVPWTNDDPLLSVYSYADWINMLGRYDHLLMILSQPCAATAPTTRSAAPNRKPASARIARADSSTRVSILE